MKQIRFFDPKRNINFASQFHTSLVVALAVPAICLVGMLLFGLNWGIDFTGGVEMQVRFDKQVDPEEIRNVLSSLGFSKNQVQEYGSKESHEVLIRIERMSTLSALDATHVQEVLTHELHLANGAKALVDFQADAGDKLVVRLPVPVLPANASPEQIKSAQLQQKNQLAEILDSKTGLHLRRSKGSKEEKPSITDALAASEPNNGYIAYTVQFMGVSDKISQALSTKFGNAEIRRVDFVDSQVSKQLRTDGTLAVLYALLGILIYIAIRFDLFFAPGAIVALLQDTFGAMLVFVLGRVEFDLPSIAALLTVLGASINNTIVVYDRIRETMPTDLKQPLTESELRNHVNKAVNDTLSRTINTTLTVLFGSVSLWLFGSGEIRSFALVLTVGLLLGAFSSTFAAPATYLFMRKHFGHKNSGQSSSLNKGLSREDKERGVV